ncbi:MAG TPA: hypothetical protein VII39_07445 [Bradyrhizobium sp.]
MRMIEANLFPAIPHPHATRHNREVTSMSDYVDSGRRSKLSGEGATIESRLMFGACYVLFLFRAVVVRLMPWRRPAQFGKFAARESIFTEASTAASVMVASSFMGL